jgi:cytochrome d ubiquinol oxidase subunit II
VWDGNEVWLIAAGGVLFMAFPKVYATAFSGFYLALMIVLWLLILRGVSIEFRSHQENPLWRELCDTVFSLASGLLAFVFGAALANLVRGLPIDESGLPGMPLFTDFRVGKHPGLFDWYSILSGLFAVGALAGHGALYLDWRTEGAIQIRSRSAARAIWIVLIPAWIVITVATIVVQPEIFLNLLHRPWSLAFCTLSIGGFVGVPYFQRRGLPLPAFLSLSAFLIGVMAATMIGNYPYWLRSTIDPAFSLTAGNSASAHYGLGIALVWWTVGMLLACAYFSYAYGSLSHKIPVDLGEKH